MRLTIEMTDHRFVLRFPTRMVLNTGVVYIACRRREQKLSLRAARTFCKQLMQFRKTHPHIPLVEVQTDDVHLIFRL